MSKASEKRAEQIEAIKFLRKRLRPGATVHCSLASVSRSGMHRWIKLFIIYRGELWNISGYVARACDLRWKDGAVGASGCGMDMGFAIVYELGRVLWPKGFKLAKGQRGRNGDASGFDNDGGYALRSQWI